MDVQIKLPCVEGLEFGSTGEAKAYLIENRDELRELVALASDIASVAFSNATVAPPDAPADEATTDATTTEPVKRRGRRSKAQIAADEAAAAAAATANAPTPPPLPTLPSPTAPVISTGMGVPTMEALPNPSVAATLPTPPAAPAPVAIATNPGTGADGLGIPPFLQRTDTPPAPALAPVETAAPAPVAVPAPAAAPAPPPPAPVAPPPPAIIKPILGPKISAHLEKVKPEAAADQKTWLTWLFTYTDESVFPEATRDHVTYDDAVKVLQFVADDKVKVIAGSLQIA